MGDRRRNIWELGVVGSCWQLLAIVETFWYVENVQGRETFCVLKYFLSITTILTPRSQHHTLNSKLTTFISQLQSSSSHSPSPCQMFLLRSPTPRPHFAQPDGSPFSKSPSSNNISERPTLNIFQYYIFQYSGYCKLPTTPTISRCSKPFSTPNNSQLPNVSSRVLNLTSRPPLSKVSIFPQHFRTPNSQHLPVLHLPVL